MGHSSSKNPTVSQPAGSPKTKQLRAVRPRDEIQDYSDPYIPDFHYPDDTVCSKCGAVYHNQHWTLDESRRNLLLSSGAANEVVCPGCKKIAEHNPQGIVTLHGDYWPEHREDILNLIRNEEKRSMQSNPVERIMDIREENGCLVVETTNPKLAQRIGREIDKAHNGRVEYKWSDTNHLVRVEWQRQLNGNGKH
jgi:hypothetical protein